MKPLQLSKQDKRTLEAADAIRELQRLEAGVNAVHLPSSVIASIPSRIGPTRILRAIEELCLAALEAGELQSHFARTPSNLGLKPGRGNIPAALPKNMRPLWKQLANAPFLHIYGSPARILFETRSLLSKETAPFRLKKTGACREGMARHETSQGSAEPTRARRPRKSSLSSAKPTPATSTPSTQN